MTGVWLTVQLALVALLVIGSSGVGAAASSRHRKKLHVPKGVSLSYPPFTSALNCSFNASPPETRACIPSNPPGEILFLDDNNVISVRYTYNKKVRLYKKKSKLAASFSTEYVINFDRDVERTVRVLFGGGFAFAITPNQDVGNSGPESLGLFEIDPATGKSLRGKKTKTVAVEIDTSRVAEETWDPQIPHVGLDIDSVHSVVDSFLWDGLSFIDRKIGVFIDYDARKEYLSVKFQNVSANGKPNKKKAKLYLEYSGLRLSDYVKEKSYVGFSSRIPVTTDGVYRLSHWKFSTKWVVTRHWH